MIEAGGPSNVVYWASHVVYSICTLFECVVYKNNNTVLTMDECTLNYKMTSQQ